MALTKDQRAHLARCAYCRGDAKLREEPVMPGRPRDSKAPLRAQPLRWRKEAAK